MSDVYTPVIGDLSSYLRVTASYEDGHGRGKSAGAVTGDPVLVNTVPRFLGVDAGGGITIEVEDGSGDAESGGAGAPVAAADPGGDTLTYSLSGDDAQFFEIDASTGQLWSKVPLDYETQATYTVVVSVRDSRDLNGDPDTAVDASVTVTIAVVNVGEPGTLTLLSSEPRTGVPFAARLTDPDGVVGEVAWKWERSRDGNPWSSSWRGIGGAESSAYEPVDADVGYCGSRRPTRTAIVRTRAGRRSRTLPSGRTSARCSRTPSLVYLRGAWRRTRTPAWAWAPRSRPRAPMAAR